MECSGGVVSVGDRTSTPNYRRKEASARARARKQRSAALPAVSLAPRRAGYLSYRIVGATFLLLEDELRRERHAKGGDWQDLLRLDEERHGNRLLFVEPEGH